jgi:hypothetical protein
MSEPLSEEANKVLDARKAAAEELKAIDSSTFGSERGR